MSASTPWRLNGRPGRCLACGVRQQLQVHHVVYQQHLRAAGGDPGDRRNMVVLCATCHELHHKAARRLKLVWLRREQLEYAFELLGPAAYDYFMRRYDDDGERRLDGLLARAMARPWSQEEHTFEEDARNVMERDLEGGT